MILGNTIKVVVIAMMACCGLVSPMAQGEFDHSQWDDLLKSHVVELGEGHATQIDYDGMLREREPLGVYLEQVSQVSRQTFEVWPKIEQLAFLINVYNAATVELILTEYPRLDSIKDLGSLFRSPFSRKSISLFGELMSLNHIEHELIRGPNGFGDPRIHFAVNCASIGCPALSVEVYSRANLEQQLEKATAMFLADSTRNRIEGNILRVSKIFDWYEEDFEQGWRGTESVSEFVALYADVLGLTSDITARLQGNEFRIRYLRYDWNLNSTNR